MLQFFKNLYVYFTSDDTVVLSKKEEVPVEETVYIQPTMKMGEHKVALSDAMTRSANPAATIRLADTSNVEEKVWIYNVSMLDFEANTSLGLVKFPSKGRKRYVVATSLPKNVMYPRYNVDSNEVHGVYTDGARVAMDMINPSNLGLDQDDADSSSNRITPLPPYAQAEGRDLGAKGVFWSLHNPPLEKELAAARKRMKTRYKILLEQAGVKARFLPKGEIARRITDLEHKGFIHEAAEEQVLGQWLQITPEHHAAMDYYKLTNEWHPIKGFTTAQ